MTYTFIAIVFAVLFAILFLDLMFSFGKINKKLDALKVQIDYIEDNLKKKDAEYKARKEWKQFRKDNLPNTPTQRFSQSSAHFEELRKKADELEMSRT
jgi:hypothetical protein